MNKEKEVEAYLKGVLPEEQKLKYEIAQEVCLQVNEKKKKICETQKKYKKHRLEAVADGAFLVY